MEIHETEILPFVQEALKFCYTKEPNDVRNRMDGSESPLYRGPPKLGSKFSLNSKTKMMPGKNAKQDLVP